MKRSIGLAFTVLFVAAACGGATGAANATPQPAVAKVTVGYSEIYEGSVPLWYAIDKGIFQKNFLDVDAKYTASSTGVAALLANQIDVFMGGGSEVLSAQVGGADFALIGNLVPIYPYVFMVPADIKTLADLKGKKVGVSSNGSTSDIATRVGLAKEGIDPDKDVTIVAVGSSQNRTAALKAGAIQGGLDQPPGYFDLTSSGFHVLFDLAALKLPVVNNGITVQRSAVTAKREVIQRYFDALTIAIKELKKDKAGGMAVIKKYLQVDDEKIQAATYDYAVALFPAIPGIAAEHLADSVRVLGQKNDKIKGYDLSKLIDNSFAKSAADRGLDKN